MEPDQFSLALEKALVRLKTRERFSGEMRAFLASNGFDEAVVDLVLEHLVRKRLLDDSRAAALLVKKKSGKRAVGSERLKAELFGMGVDEAVIEVSVADGGDVDAAIAALSSKRTWSGRAQAGRFLSGRGFAEDIIESVLDRAFGEAQPTD